MKKTNYLLIYLLLILLFNVFTTQANNLTIENIELKNKNTKYKTVNIQFDISWENSWRTSSAPANYDAVWIFVKYRIGTGEWQHATLHTDSMEHTMHSEAAVEPANDGKGLFIFRAEDGTGNIDWDNILIRWKYGTDGVGDNESNLEVKVLGIEMVYIPEGSFYLGDGTADVSFCQSGNTDPVQITTDEVIVKTKDASIHATDDDKLETTGILIDGDDGIDTDGHTAIDNSNFPTGYKSFYIMKYEISQQQYVDFLNMLTATQQANRTTAVDVGDYADKDGLATSPKSRNSIKCSVAGSPRTYVCNLNGDNTGGDIACNYISWQDGAAYTDWAALRPMTELEYEKACRGPETPVAGEFAWGTNQIASVEYTLNNSGASNEAIGNSIEDGTTGNACYSVTNDISNRDADSRPMRCGIFAASASSATRVSTGASYYGVMELSGNLYERCVHISNSTGRSFTGAHGDGLLTTDGYGDVANWPGYVTDKISDFAGSNFRGGNSNDDAARSMVSNRYDGSYEGGSRTQRDGFRSVRTAKQP